MDVIGDTELALASAFLPDSPADLGTNYLRAYGSLQAMFVQQDAVRAIAEAIGAKHSTSDARLRRIRTVRNLSIGHPTRTARPPAVSFIIQISLEACGFQLLSMFDSGAQTTEYVALEQLAAEQRALHAAIIDGCTSHLQSEHKEHKEHYKHMKLSESLSPVGYHLGKLYDVIESDDNDFVRQLGEVHLVSVEQALARAEKGLREREELQPRLDSLGPELEIARHCIARLRTAFQTGRMSKDARLDAESSRRTLRETLTDLGALLNEMDAEYNS